MFQRWLCIAFGATLLGISICTASAQVVTAPIPTPIPTPIHGITVADNHDIRSKKYLQQVLTSVGNLTVNPTVRLTFTVEADATDVDGKRQGARASTYLAATQALAQKAYILGEVVDSSAMACFTVADHDARWKEYLSTLGSFVDVWEVGNEINGDWLENPHPSVSKRRDCPWPEPKTTEADVVTKGMDAYRMVKKAGKAAAITLYYEPNPACSRSLPPANDPILWAKNNLPADMRTGMDYVFISFYPDNCPHYQPDWTGLFSALQRIFPNAQMGIGEWGYSQHRPSNAALKRLLREGYGIHPAVKNWAGGVFDWEFGLDAVPYEDDPNSIWGAINIDMQQQK